MVRVLRLTPLVAETLVVLKLLFVVGVVNHRVLVLACRIKNSKLSVCQMRSLCFILTDEKKEG